MSLFLTLKTHLSTDPQYPYRICKMPTMWWNYIDYPGGHCGDKAGPSVHLFHGRGFSQVHYMNLYDL
jgi:hypothetical protein